MDEKLKAFAEKLKSAKSCYAAGGMQKRKQPNRWRKIQAEFLEKNNVKLVNPVEDNKDIFSPSMMGFKSEGVPNTLEDLLISDPKKRRMMFKQTEENDLHFMANVDFHIFYFDESVGFGTNTEFRENYDNFKKPCVIVRTIPIDDLAHWNEWRYGDMIDSGNAIEFKTFTDMQDFFVEYLGFKK